MGNGVVVCQLARSEVALGLWGCDWLGEYFMSVIVDTSSLENLEYSKRHDAEASCLTETS